MYAPTYRRHQSPLLQVIHTHQPTLLSLLTTSSLIEFDNYFFLHQVCFLFLPSHGLFLPKFLVFFNFPRKNLYNMSHFNFYKHDYKYFTWGTFVCVLIFQKISHFENSQKLSYRNNAKMTYLKFILGLFSNPNFHRSYFQNYRKSKSKIFNTSIDLFSVSRFHILKHLKKNYNKNSKLTYLNHILEHLRTLTSSYHIYKIIVK